VLNGLFRIKKNEDFKRVFIKGRFLRDRLFLLKYEKNSSGISRFGFVVSLKVSKRAVDRNLVKRRLRDIIRLNLDNIKDGYDVVFATNSNILKADYKSLERSVLTSLYRAGLLKKQQSCDRL